MDDDEEDNSEEDQDCHDDVVVEIYIAFHGFVLMEHEASKMAVTLYPEYNTKHNIEGTE